MNERQLAEIKRELDEYSENRRKQIASSLAPEAVALFTTFFEMMVCVECRTGLPRKAVRIL